jgi:glycosyltransferase involved in cell wall biosynthesis
MRLSVIIPVYNEKDLVEKVIASVKAVPVEKEIIVVDDFSTDGTHEKLLDMKDIKLIQHNRNQGKGSAIRNAIEQTTGDIVVIQDADLEYNPQDYIRLLAQFQNPKINAVYGSRFKGKSKFLFLSKFANRILTTLTNILFSGRISDMETCYKMIRKNILLDLNLTAKRFEIEPEITAKLLRKKIKIIEIPINYQARTIGKNIGVKDGFIAIWELIKWWI